MQLLSLSVWQIIAHVEQIAPMSNKC